VGAVASLIGVLGVVFIVWFTYRAWLVEVLTDSFFLGLSPIVVAVTLFCLTVGYRLTLDRPRSTGSLLSVFTWRAIGLIFAAMAAVFGVSAIKLSEFGFFTGVLFTAILSACCFHAAQRAKGLQEKWKEGS
jgi:hypothetical protein